MLSRARYVGGEGEGEEEEGDLFNYEEEITLDCVDEVSSCHNVCMSQKSLNEKYDSCISIFRNCLIFTNQSYP